MYLETSLHHISYKPNIQLENCSATSNSGWRTSSNHIKNLALISHKMLRTVLDLLNEFMNIFYKIVHTKAVNSWLTTFLASYVFLNTLFDIVKWSIINTCGFRETSLFICKQTTPLYFTGLVRVLKIYREASKILHSKVKCFRIFFALKCSQNIFLN